MDSQTAKTFGEPTMMGVNLSCHAFKIATDKSSTVVGAFGACCVRLYERKCNDTAIERRAREIFESTAKFDYTDHQKNIIWYFVTTLFALNQRKLSTKFREDFDMPLSNAITLEEFVARKNREQGLQEGLQKGHQEGLQKGIQKGIQKTNLEHAKIMLSLGIPIQQIVQVTKLSENKVLFLKKGLDN
jgi:predicted transposase/invertase (TIGR01784 family)